MRIPKTLLLVDDDETLRVRLARAFRARGVRVLPAASVDEALEHLAHETPDLAVIDLKMPGRSGLELLSELRQRSASTNSVVLTGYGSISNAVEAMREGAVDYLTKPADADQILDTLLTDDVRQSEREAAEFKPLSLAEAEWNHIQKVLADCEGNLTRAAEMLEIPRRTLQRKLKKLAP
jgi:two-component system response regulator RegA